MINEFQKLGDKTLNETYKKINKRILATPEFNEWIQRCVARYGENVRGVRLSLLGPGIAYQIVTSRGLIEFGGISRALSQITEPLIHLRERMTNMDEFKNPLFWQEYASCQNTAKGRVLYQNRNAVTLFGKYSKEQWMSGKGLGEFEAQVYAAMMTVSSRHWMRDLFATSPKMGAIARILDEVEVVGTKTSEEMINERFKRAADRGEVIDVDEPTTKRLSA
jgi:hypothetical protein